MQPLRISLFGRFDVRHDSTTVQLPAKAEELLCYLLLHRGRSLNRGILATALWAEANGAQSKKYLRQSLWQLQRALESKVAGAPPLLNLSRDWVAIHQAAEITVDVYQFENGFATVQDQPGEQLTPAQADAAQAAADMYRGALLAGWYQDWCLVEREHYQSLLFTLLEKLVDYFLTRGLLEAGLGYGQRLLRLEPARERTHQRLMLLHAAAGDRGAALRQFEQCVMVLKREFNVDPAEATLALCSAIRAGHVHAPSAQSSSRIPGVHEELVQLRAHVDVLRRELEQLRALQGRQSSTVVSSV